MKVNLLRCNTNILQTTDFTVDVSKDFKHRVNCNHSNISTATEQMRSLYGKSQHVSLSLLMHTEMLLLLSKHLFC